MEITLSSLSFLLETTTGGRLFCGGGSSGLCVRELRSLALGLEVVGTPDGGGSVDSCCQLINDAGSWEDPQDRAHYCLPLALLSASTAPNLWEHVFLLRIIREVLPPFFRTMDQNQVAELCEKCGSDLMAELATHTSSHLAISIANHLNAREHIVAVLGILNTIFLDPTGPSRWCAAKRCYTIALCRILYECAAGQDLPPWPH